MFRPSARRSRQPESRRPVPYVGDNLDRLLGLLEAARAEQDRRLRADRETSYRTLAARIVSTPRIAARSCA